jgi:type IV secretion system protein VirB6
MTLACAAQNSTLVQGLLGTIDCQVEAATSLGYGVLGGPESTVALTGTLTLYIAVYGFRLMLGLTPLRAGELTVMALKLGMVLALAGNWPDYQRLLTSVLVAWPQQAAGAFLAATRSSSTLLQNGPFDGLQSAYDQMVSAATFLNHISPPSASPFTGGTGSAAFCLNASATLLLFATLGVVLAAKVLLAIALELGPVVAALLLFPITQGIALNWARLTAGCAAASAAATLALTVALILLDPYLPALAQHNMSGLPEMSAVTSVFVITVVTSIISLAGVIGAGLLLAGLGLSDRIDWRGTTGGQPSMISALANDAVIPVVSGLAPVAPYAPRQIIAGAAAAASLSRRETRLIEKVESGSRHAYAEAVAAQASGNARRPAAHPHHATNARKT